MELARALLPRLRRSITPGMFARRLALAIARAKRLSEQIGTMNSAGPLMRLYVVATNFDPEIAHSALDNYEPAAPLSLGAHGQRTRGALGMGGDTPRRVALRSPLGRRARNSRATSAG